MLSFLITFLIGVFSTYKGIRAIIDEEVEVRGGAHFKKENPIGYYIFTALFLIGGLFLSIFSAIVLFK